MAEKNDVDPWGKAMRDQWMGYTEDRINNIGQNGNDGLHYDQEPMGAISKIDPNDFPNLVFTGSSNRGGVKYDQDKIKMELLPPEFLTEIGKVLTFGAKKYAERNWEKGMDWGRVYGALQRHLNAWMSGESEDPETGYSHLSHAGCCIAFLITYEQRGIGNDNRH